MPGTMFDVLERLEEKVDRNEKTGQKTQRAAKKAARHGRFTKIVVLILLILLILFGVWFVHATQRAVSRVTGPLDKLHDLAKPFTFGISGDIPGPTYDAYQNAASKAPTECHLTWTMLAGIGKIETSNGTFGGAAPDASGEVTPAIRGVVLDGSTSGTAVIYDTDGGEYDGDPVYDRAVGPMQFLPSTWAALMPSGSDPQNVNDAAEATAKLLCSHGDLSDPSTLSQAIFSYNPSDQYVSDVEQWKTSYDGVAAQQPAAGSAVADDKGPSVWQVMRDEAWSWWAKVNWGPLRVLNPVAEYWLRPSKAAKKENSSLPAAAQTQSALTGSDGLNPDFSKRLASMAAAAPGAVSIESGYRSTAEQQTIVDAHGGDCGVWVACVVDGVCGSMHCKGLAADLAFQDDATEAWVHQHMAEFKLCQPMDYEPWHLQPSETCVVI